VSSAANPAPVGQQQAPSRRHRHGKPTVTRRSAVQLLIGVLVVGAIPIVSTARILQANALRNERAHADSALRDELQNGLRELGRLGDDASARVSDLANSPTVQRAVIKRDVATLRRLAAQRPGIAFYLRTKLVAGTQPRDSTQQSLWLTVDGARVARIVASAPLDAQLARRLTRDAPHGRADRLVLVQHGRLVGGGSRLAVEGQTVRFHGVDYRGLPALVPGSSGVRLMALRPEGEIRATVKPYQERVRYAAIGSFALLILVAFLFAGPVLRVLGDFRRVASQASTDGLTGLANRRLLDEELVLEWRRADRVGASLAFVLLDLDDFKRVNDTHGHLAGDAVLRVVGRVLAEGVRQVDLAGRYGGEEFALILPETELPGAHKLAERVRSTLEATAIELPDGQTLRVTASFGVALKDAQATPEDLVSAADDALYAAKAAGKNRVMPQPAGVGPPVGEPERRKPKKAAKRPASTPKRKASPGKPAKGEI